MMCSMDLQPFTIVEDPGFLTYSYVLNPHFKPGTPTFYRDLLKKVYVKGKDKIVSKIVKDKPEAVCAQLDGWTENQNSYIGLIVNYITIAVNIFSRMDENWTHGMMEKNLQMRVPKNF